jgi:hypothetical protein
LESEKLDEECIAAHDDKTDRKQVTGQDHRQPKHATEYQEIQGPNMELTEYFTN